ncbi:MAG: hypothetical protein HY421_00425 [Candidatus Kerfeldbacteria bacterium]|nr:hypothetical protein [Candidatus Kerfeldbacteria bacterium]
MLSDRQDRILTDVVRTYIRQAHPIASQAVLEKSQLELSPATIRHEMLELERDGYLLQPYTSAGRIPTLKAWRHYLEHQRDERPVSQRAQDELQAVVRAYRQTYDELLKHLAQTLAEQTRQAVFVAFDQHDTYYTGISKLFAQPEFDQVDAIRAISRVVDRLDEVMPRYFRLMERDVEVLLGPASHVSDDCSLILSRLPRRTSLLGVLGPVRQDYDSHVSLLRFTRQLLQAA